MRCSFAVLALVLSYAGRAVLQAEPFADRAVATLKSPAVQDDVADHLTDVVVRQGGGDLVTVRPLVRAVTGAVVGSGAFAGLFRRAALELHASLVSGHGGAVLLTVADAGVLLQGALERLAPDAAGRVGSDRLARLGSLYPVRAVLGVVRFARRVYAIAWALAVASILLGVLAFWLSRDRRRTALVSNPGEVVIVINQDEGVTPGDIERAFDRAGLLDLVYRGPFGPFPTLPQMIDSGQRLVVMAENDAGDIPWYPLAYGNALQDTPFTSRSAAALTEPPQVAESCRPNRGPASAPLFLVNNWVDTTPLPRASIAAVVNAHPALLRRTETCQRIRHRLPNLVAVDFYRQGDVLGVVRALNGLPP